MAHPVLRGESAWQLSPQRRYQPYTRDRFIRRPISGAIFSARPRPDTKRREQLYRGLIHDAPHNPSVFAEAKPLKMRRATYRRNYHPPVRPCIKSITPKRILDAPYLDTDFYKNVLTWSKDNILCVALGNTLYGQNLDTKVTSALYTVEHEMPASISAVHAFEAISSYIAFSHQSDVQALPYHTKFLDISNETVVRTVGTTASEVVSIATLGSVIACGMRNSLIATYDVRQREAHIASYPHGEENAAVCSLLWSEQYEHTLISGGGDDDTVKVWDVRTQRTTHTMTHKASIKGLAWQPNNNMVLFVGTGAADRQIYSYKLGAEGVVGARRKQITSGQITSLFFNAEGTQLVSTHGYLSNQGIVWQVGKDEQLTKIATLDWHRERILYATMSPDGHTLCTGGEDERICFWHPWQPEKKAPPHPSHFDSFTIR